MEEIQAIKELTNGLLDILSDKNQPLDERFKALNVLKFIETYDVSIEILREHDSRYNDTSKVRNITRFIEDYENNLELLLVNNAKVIKYVRSKYDRD